MDEVYRENVQRLVKRDSYTPPAESFPGVRYIPPGDADADDWSTVRELWSETEPG